MRINQISICNWKGITACLLCYVEMTQDDWTIEQKRAIVGRNLRGEVNGIFDILILISADDGGV